MAEKSNTIGAIPARLGMMAIEGTAVTLGARKGVPKVLKIVIPEQVAILAFPQKWMLQH